MAYELLLLAALAAILAFGLASIAARTKLLPDVANNRSNHVSVASRAGGLVIVAAVVVAMVVAGFVSPLAELPIAAACAAAAGLLGLADDRINLAAGLKFAVLIVICTFSAIAVGPLLAIPLPMGDYVELPRIAGYALTTAFLFGFANTFNFMDGLNGVAGGAAVIGLLLVAWVSGTSASGIVFWLVTAAAIYGFLIPNVSARFIFLGDCGSLAIGMLLAASAVEVTQSRPPVIFIFAICFLPFIADVGYTFVRRIGRSENVLLAHRDHVYQRLRRTGLSHQAVAGIYIGMVAAAGGLAILLEAVAGASGLWIAAAATLVLIAVVWKWVMPGVESTTAAQPN